MKPEPARLGLRRPLATLRHALPEGAQLPEPIFRRWDRVLRVVLWAHVPVLALLVERYQGLSVHSGAELLVVPALALLAQQVRNRVWRSCVTSVALVTCSALLVHVTSGLIEAHFHFFFVVAIIALYQDWRPFLVAATYVLVHHGVLGVLAPQVVYNHPAAIASPVLWAVIHAVAIGATAMVQLVFWRGNEQARRAYEAARGEAADQAERAELLTHRADSAERSARLLNIAAALSEAVTIGQVASVLVDSGTEALGADACGFALLDDDGENLRLVRWRGYDADFGRRWSPLPLTTRAPLTDAVRTGSPVYVSSRGALLGTYPHLADVAVPAESWTSMPLRVAGRVAGGWTLAWPTAREIPEDERVFLDTVAVLGSSALERAQMYEHERDSARLLQRGLLPAGLPELPGVCIETRYHPSSGGGEVGGDWYDVIRLPSGAIGVAVGDVIGHGLGAAAVMGQIRTTLRAYAVEGHSPAVVMERVNSMLVDTEEPDRDVITRLATCVYLELDADAKSLVVSSAGHPPPLLVPDGGPPQLIDLEPNLPLGADPTMRYTESVLTLPADSTVVLYTDGLVEQRGLSMQEGLDALVERASAVAGAPPDELADQLLSGRLAQEHDDDVTLLALRCQCVVQSRTFSETCRLPAVPASAGAAREFVRRVLDGGPSADLADTAELLTSELATNAVVHTASAQFDLGVMVARDGVRVSVSDSSPYEPQVQPADDERTSGRGMAILEALAVDWGVERRPDGKSVWFKLAA